MLAIWLDKTEGLDAATTAWGKERLPLQIDFKTTPKDGEQQVEMVIQQSHLGIVCECCIYFV